jgi:primosomal protein N' (replication factor Y)
MDLDSVRKKGSLEAILSRFASGKTDILIGTQLVAKGLDFANVGLVGIISADVSLNIPDYRSAERTFQLVTQAAGRAGRGDEQGSVIIQTYAPEHPALTAAAAQDYAAFYAREIQMRKLVGYPPYADLFQIVLSSPDEAENAAACAACRAELEKRLPQGCVVLGPSKAPINKAGGAFRHQIVIKSPAGSRRAVCAAINEIKRSRPQEPLMTVDINPFSML